MGFADKIKNIFKSHDTFISQNWTSIDKFQDFFSWGNDKISINKFLKAYRTNPLVYMVVHKISATSGSMPIIVEDDNGNVLDNSQILELLQNPNFEQSQIEFRQEINESLLLTGNAFIYFGNGEEFASRDTLTVLKPDCVQLRYNGNGLLLKYDYTDEFGNFFPYDVEDVLHIKTSNLVVPENCEKGLGLSPLEGAYIVVQSSSEKFEAEASIFKNRGVVGILTNKSDTPMLPDERERLQGEFDQEMGGAEKFNKIKISTTDLNYIQTGMSPTDLKLIEGLIESKRTICAIYGMPSVLFNDAANSSYNNYATAVEIAYTDVYIPLADKINEKLSRFLSEKYKVKELIKVDLKELDAINLNTNDLAQSLSSLPPLLSDAIIQDMTPNERRSIVNLDNIAGGDDVAAVSGANNVNLNL